MMRISLSTAICAVSLSIAAILGVLTRAWVNSLFGEDGASVSADDDIVFYDLAANVLGCFVFGLHRSLKEPLKVPSALSLAISTGYAGSVTTFASWNYQVVRMLVTGLWLEALGALFFGLCTSLVALTVGSDTGIALLSIFGEKERTGFNTDMSQEEPTAENVAPSMSRSSEKLDRTRPSQVFVFAMLLVVLLLAWSGTISGAIVDRESELRRSFWAGSMFAPVGAIFRWRLSLLNGWRPTFPIGTFIANMTAMLIDVAIGAAMLRHTPSSDEKVFLQALITGLGGSLSTVSTWLGESVRLRRRDKYVYILGTILSAQAVGMLVYGTTYWSIKD